jgi:hypothetical protein
MRVTNDILLGCPLPLTFTTINSVQTLKVAHAYTRYLGDLSGGQVLARVARKTYGLEKGGAGTQFYEFDNIENKNGYKKGYRARLDGTVLMFLCMLFFDRFALLADAVGSHAPVSSSQKPVSTRVAPITLDTSFGCPLLLRLPSWVLPFSFLHFDSIPVQH